MFDASRRDPSDPLADTSVSDDPPPVSIEVFGRDPLIGDQPAVRRATTTRDETPDESTTPEASAAPPRREAPRSSAEAPTPLAARSLQDGLLSLVDARLGGLESQVQEMARQAAFLPPKLRGLGDKLADLAAPLSDARSRALMVDLLMIDDIVRSGLAAEDDGQAAQRTLSAVSQLMGSVFESHGIVEIDTEGGFDPTLHQAVQQLPVDEPGHDGVILEVYRRGLRTEQRVLRYAEVGVARYQPAPLDDDSDEFDGPGEPADDAAPRRAGRGSTRPTHRTTGDDDSSDPD